MIVAVNGLSARAGGGITFLRHQVEAWAENGHRVVLFVDRDAASSFSSHPLIDVRIPLHRKWPVPLRILYEQAILPRHVRDCSPSVVYCPGGFAFFRVVAPQVTTLQNPNLHDRERRGRTARERLHRRAEELLARAVLSRAAHVVFISKTDRAQWERQFGARYVSASVVYSGVSQDICAAPDLIPNSSGAILTVGNIALHKRLDVLLEGFRIYCESGGNRDLEIVGAPRSQRMEERLKHWLNALPSGVRNRIKIHGTLDRNSVAEKLKTAWTYASTSDLESFGLTPLEAMVCRLPIVLSDIPTFREIAADAAIYFRPGDASGLARCLLELDINSQLRESLIIAGSHRLECFSWARNATQMLEIFERVASGRNL